jgi:hypothetical protein
MSADEPYLKRAWELKNGIYFNILFISVVKHLAMNLLTVDLPNCILNLDSLLAVFQL